MLSAGTRLLGVVGWPVGHSLSPGMQGAALAALGLPWAYGAFAVPPAQLAAAIAGAAALDFVGLNVTIPHKQAALALCQPDEIARGVGAVNTLRFTRDGDRPGAIVGSNTDVHGFTCLCAEAGVPLRPGLRALVLGSGGAARAVLYALRQAGAHFTVAGRRPGRVPGGLTASEEVLPLDRQHLAPLLPGCDLVVDSTPRGLQAPRDLAPAAALAAVQQSHPELDLARLPPHAVVLDLVAGLPTVVVTAAWAHGLRAQGGDAMLVHQGAAALACWLGQPSQGVAAGATLQPVPHQVPPHVIDAMRAAVAVAGSPWIADREAPR